MLYIAVCYDKPDSQALRLANRGAHLDFLRTNANDIKVCGPILAEDHETMIGSMLIVEAPDRPAADDDDERRRYYRITAAGRRTVEAETNRMASWVAAARAAGRGRAT